MGDAGRLRVGSMQYIELVHDLFILLLGLANLANDFATIIISVD